MRVFGRVWAILPGLCVCSGCAAQASTEAVQAGPGGEAGVAATVPAATALPASDPRAEAWLERIGRKHAEARTLTAELVYDRIQGILGDRQRRLGTLVYEAGPPARFAVHFDRLLVDQRLVEQDRWYVFDGRWLVERLATERQFLAYEVVPPNAGPVDPLAVGQGPFVVPISPDTKRLLERFDAAVMEATEGDPPDSLHLRLTPRADRRSEFTRIDIWYDRESLLPVQVWTADESENESKVVLREIKVNAPVEAGVFDTQPPAERGWDVQISPWEGEP